MTEEEKAPGAETPGSATMPTQGSTEGVSAAGSTSDTPAPKHRGLAKKGRVALGVAAAVIVVAGAGFWVWHEQPSFCNAICHTPMDPYVESYTSDNPAFGVTAHAEAGETCLSCHEAVLTDQVSEAMAWMADDFETTDEGMLAYDYGFATEEFCARSGCHNMDEVTAETWGFEGNDAKYNPHSSHQDLALECGDCHKAHQASVLVCNDCHDLNAPEGWEA